MYISINISHPDSKGVSSDETGTELYLLFQLGNDEVLPTLQSVEGNFANQNTISIILKILIPVKRPRVPPVFLKREEYCFFTKCLNI